MGGSRIFNWGGPRIEMARDDCQNVALFAWKCWPIGGAMALWPPPPGTALDCNLLREVRLGGLGSKGPTLGQYVSACATIPLGSESM